MATRRRALLLFPLALLSAATGVAAAAAGDADAYPEASCALSLLSRYLTADAGVDLYVDGDASWLRVLLAAWGARSAVRTTYRSPWSENFVAAPSSFVLVATDQADYLPRAAAAAVLKHTRTHILLWTRLNRTAVPGQEEQVAADLARAFAALDLPTTINQVRLAVTAVSSAASAITALFDGVWDWDHDKVSLLDSCSAASDWARGAADAFDPPCRVWRPPSLSEPVLVHIVPTEGRIGGFGGLGRRWDIRPAWLEKLPGLEPDKGPGRGPVRGPGQGPGQGPGRGTGQGPGPGPGQGLGRGPGQGLGRGPGQGPGRGPGQGPGPGPGQGLSQGPSQGPGRGPGQGPDQGTSGRRIGPWLPAAGPVQRLDQGPGQGNGQWTLNQRRDPSPSTAGRGIGSWPAGIGQGFEPGLSLTQGWPPNKETGGSQVPGPRPGGESARGRDPEKGQVGLGSGQELGGFGANLGRGRGGGIRVNSWEAMATNFINELHARQNLRFPHRTEILPLNSEGVALRRTLTCRLDLVMSEEPLNATLHRDLAVFPWDMHSAEAVVPAGMGESYSPFHKLITELSPTLWFATVLSAAAVAAGLLCIGDRGLVTVALITMSPLVSQSVARPPRSRQRPIFGGWLLVSLVVSSAYQGELLSDLALSSRREIDTLKQLADSRLPVFFWKAYEVDSYPLDLWGLDGRVILDTSATAGDAYRRTATFRNISFFRDISDRGLGKNMFFQSSQPVHTFALPITRLKATYTTMAGSPYEVPLRKFLGRLRAAGLTIQSLQSTYMSRLRGGTRLRRWADGPQPLTLQQVQPALQLLAFCHALAFAVFLAEQVGGLCPGCAD